MITSPPIPPAAPTIPLTPEVRAAYQKLYDLCQSALNNTNDLVVFETLDDLRNAVDDILTKDNMYRLHADTALYTALGDQIKDTNDNLQTVKAQIQAVASHIALAGDIIAAIAKLATLVPMA